MMLSLQSVSSTGPEILRNHIERFLSIFVHNDTAFKISDIGRKRDIDYYNISLSGFERYWVPPSDIQRMTGREWKPWSNKKNCLGAIKPGDWDQRAPPVPDSDPLYPHYSEKFNEFSRYMSYKNYLNGTAWTDTRYYNLRSNEGWSHERLMEELQHLEYLYETINKKGYMTQKELGNYSKNKRARLVNEITIDISRDGEFLHVDGHHRLEVAKHLDLDSVPVVVLVRHKRWAEKLEQVARTGDMSSVPTNHPDVKQCMN